MCGSLYFFRDRDFVIYRSYPWISHGCYVKGCYALRCELCTVATILLGYQQALAVRWLVAFPICSLLLSKKGLWPSLWAVWHLFFASIQKNEAWDENEKWRKNEMKKKKRSPSGSIFLVPRYYTMLHHLPHAKPGSASLYVAGAVAKPFCWLALAGSEGVVVGVPLVWKGRKKQQKYSELNALSDQSSILGGTLGDLAVTPKG